MRTTRGSLSPALNPPSVQPHGRTSPRGRVTHTRRGQSYTAPGPVHTREARLDTRAGPRAGVDGPTRRSHVLATPDPRSDLTPGPAGRTRRGHSHGTAHTRAARPLGPEPRRPPTGRRGRKGGPRRRSAAHRPPRPGRRPTARARAARVVGGTCAGTRAGRGGRVASLGESDGDRRGGPAAAEGGVRAPRQATRARRAGLGPLARAPPTDPGTHGAADARPARASRPPSTRVLTREGAPAESRDRGPAAGPGGGPGARRGGGQVWPPSLSRSLAPSALPRARRWSSEPLPTVSLPQREGPLC